MHADAAPGGYPSGGAAETCVEKTPVVINRRLATDDSSSLIINIYLLKIIYWLSIADQVLFSKNNNKKVSLTNIKNKFSSYNNNLVTSNRKKKKNYFDKLNYNSNRKIIKSGKL